MGWYYASPTVVLLGCAYIRWSGWVRKQSQDKSCWFASKIFVTQMEITGSTEITACTHGRGAPDSRSSQLGFPWDLTGTNPRSPNELRKAVPALCSFANRILVSAAVWGCLFQFSASFSIAYKEYSNRNRRKDYFIMLNYLWVSSLKRHQASVMLLCKWQDAHKGDVVHPWISAVVSDLPQPEFTCWTWLASSPWAQSFPRGSYAFGLAC